MESVLSQSEVNALLDAVNQGRLDAGADEVSLDEDARPYDLTSNDRIMRGRMPVLEVLNQKMARLMRVSFFNTLRKSVRVGLESSQLVKFNEFINTIGSPACLSLFRMPPLEGACVVSIDSDLVFGIVDQVFGGAGGWYRVEGREYSGIELRLVEKVVRGILGDLKVAWDRVVDVEPEFVRTEVNPQFAMIAAPKDVTLVTAFEVELESSNKGNVLIVIPYSVIQPIRESLASTLQTDRGQGKNSWGSHIREVLEDAQVEMLARLGRGKLSVRELTDLKVGDVIQLDRQANAPVDCEVEGVLKTKGWPVTSRGRLSLRLVGGMGESTARKDGGDAAAESAADKMVIPPAEGEERAGNG